MRDVRGRRIAMIFQEPGASLNPVMTVGEQMREVLARHLGLAGAAAERRVLELLEAVGIPDPARRLGRVSVPALRRHEAARDDRSGARLRAGTADGGRADHRARRHHPGPGARPAARPAAPHRHGDAAHHPRPRRRVGDGASRRRDVRRRDRRDRVARELLQPPGASVLAQAVRLAARARAARAASRGDPRHRAAAVVRVQGLPLRRSLRPGWAQCREQAPAVHRIGETQAVRCHLFARGRVDAGARERRSRGVGTGPGTAARRRRTSRRRRPRCWRWRTCACISRSGAACSSASSAT